jgi:threonine dehydratase
VRTSNTVTLTEIQEARERIGDAIYHSPAPYSLSLSRLCGCEIRCKLDHLQMTGSFKERGARNKLLLLTDEQQRLGVVAASAGNHALGLAYHGQLLKIPVTVVMPKWAPLVKVSNCRSFGANVLIDGETYDEARAKAVALAKQKGLAYIAGFDDPDIIAGQGTLGLEIIEDVPDVDVVIVPVGGGGLIAGVGFAVKALKPDVRVIGVEPVNAPTLHESLKRGKVTKVETKPTLADGLAVAQAGDLCFEIARKVVDEVVLVNEGQIAHAILRLLEMEKMVIEGAGAVPLAAAMNPEMDLKGKNVVLVLAGGNIDMTLVSHVIERGLAADGRLCRIRAYVSDRPGSLANLTAILASTGASVREVQHDRHFGPPDVALVAITCVLETKGFDHIEEIKKALSGAGVQYSLGSQN